MSSPADGNLSPRLAELAKPSVRALPPAKQAARLSVAAGGPGSLLREGNRVLVDVRFDHGAAAGVEALRGAGAQIVNVSRRYQTVTVAAKPAELREVAGVTRVAGVTEDLAPILSATCPSGEVVSEGDDTAAGGGSAKQLRRGRQRRHRRHPLRLLRPGHLGSLDESGPIATHAPEDVASGDLPGPGNLQRQNTAPVNVLDDSRDAEGGPTRDARWPRSSTTSPPAPRSPSRRHSTREISFAENIEQLAKPDPEGGGGAKVIADDVAYFDEPFFQDGPVAAAVNKVTAEGVDYFSAAGNDNLFNSNGNEIASWEAPAFRDSGSCPAGVPLSSSLEHCMDFNPSSGEVDDTFGITVAKGATLTVDLQWAEPWYEVQTDLDAYLVRLRGQIACEGRYGQRGADGRASRGTPVEKYHWRQQGSPACREQVLRNVQSASQRHEYTSA